MIRTRPHTSEDDSIPAASWWDENRQQVEDQFLTSLLASDERKPYTGPERRSIATLTLDPQDAAKARDQARLAGVAFEVYASGLFHEAVERVERLEGAPPPAQDGRLGPCKVERRSRESWHSTSAKSA